MVGQRVAVSFRSMHERLEPGTARAPRVWTVSEGEHIGLMAAIDGVLDYDDENDCLTVNGAPVVWPAGTVPATGVIGVTTPNGTTYRVGDTVAGNGGYVPRLEQWDVPAKCRGQRDSVLLFNPNR